MEIDGQCHCGAVRYHARIDPQNVSVCHCTDCQRLSGSPYRVSVMARREDIAIEGAKPSVYEKHGQNGRPRYQYFCGTCGSPIFTSGDGEDAFDWGIRWGSVRQRLNLIPKRQIWCRSAAPFLDEVSRLPGSQEEA